MFRARLYSECQYKLTSTYTSSPIKLIPQTGNRNAAKIILYHIFMQWKVSMMRLADKCNQITLRRLIRIHSILKNKNNNSSRHLVKACNETVTGTLLVKTLVFPTPIVVTTCRRCLWQRNKHCMQLVHILHSPLSYAWTVPRPQPLPKHSSQNRKHFWIFWTGERWNL